MSRQALERLDWFLGGVITLAGALLLTFVILAEIQWSAAMIQAVGSIAAIIVSAGIFYADHLRARLNARNEKRAKAVAFAVDLDLALGELERRLEVTVNDTWMGFDTAASMHMFLFRRDGPLDEVQNARLQAHLFEDEVRDKIVAMTAKWRWFASVCEHRCQLCPDGESYRSKLKLNGDYKAMRGHLGKLRQMLRPYIPDEIRQAEYTFKQ